MPVVPLGNEIGRAIDGLINLYLADPEIAPDWRVLSKTWVEAAKIAYFGPMTLLRERVGSDDDFRLLLQERSRERLHGTLDWEDVGRRLGTEKVHAFRVAFEEAYQAQDEYLHVIGLYDAFLGFAYHWGLDYPWIIEVLWLRMLLDAELIPKEIPEDDEGLLLPDLAPALRLPELTWRDAGTPVKKQLDESRSRLREWKERLRRESGFIEPIPDLEQHVYWVYLTDRKQKTAVQICGNPELNPKGRKARQIQQAVSSLHKMLGKLSPTKRGRPPTRKAQSNNNLRL